MQSPAGKMAAAFLLVALAEPVLSQPAAGIQFRFAFGAITGAGSNLQLIRIAEDTQLRTGDRMKLMIEMEQPEFVYLIHRSSENEIEWLFPGDRTERVQVGRKYFIPDGALWFQLDGTPGSETFYLLASTQRSSELEALLDRHSKAPASDRAALTTAIVSEIRRLRTQHLNAAAPAERPVMIGGNVRSLATAPGASLPDVSTIAVEITAKDFYARTFTIEHR